MGSTAGGQGDTCMPPTPPFSTMGSTSGGQGDICTPLPNNGFFWKFLELTQCETPADAIPAIAILIIFLSTIAIFTIPVSISTSVFPDTTYKYVIIQSLILCSANSWEHPDLPRMPREYDSQMGKSLQYHKMWQLHHLSNIHFVTRLQVSGVLQRKKLTHITILDCPHITILDCPVFTRQNLHFSQGVYLFLLM